MTESTRTAHATTTAIPEIADIPYIPTNTEHEIVFNNPWEAKAFAMVVQLYQQGHFTWPEWAESLGQEIAASVELDGSDYYLLWLAAAEKLVATKALCEPQELTSRKAALESGQGGPAS